MDNLWEDAGEVWTTYRADTPDATTRSVYFNNAVTAFGKVQVVFGKKENGKIEWMNGEAVLDASWAEGRRANNNVDKSTYSSWGKGWLNMSQMDGNQIGEHTIPANVWGFTDVPAEYTHVMFRGALDANADDNNKKLYPEDKGYFWFSPPLEINATYTNPCFFAYRYLDEGPSGGADDNAQPGDPNFLDGQWGSALEIYSLGDGSAEVPAGEFSTQDNTYYATATLYDYYSLWEQSGHSITEAPGGYDYNKQGVLLNIGISKYFEELDGAAVGTSTRTPLYFGAGNMRNTDVSGDWSWDSYLSNSFKQFNTLYEMNSQLYNNTDHANVWAADDGSRRDLVDTSLTNDTLTQNGHAAPYFSETFLRGDNALDITLGSPSPKTRTDTGNTTAARKAAPSNRTPTGPIIWRKRPRSMQTPGMTRLLSCHFMRLQPITELRINKRSCPNSTTCSASALT